MGVLQMELNWVQFCRYRHLSDDERSMLFREVKRLMRGEGIDLHTSDTFPVSTWKDMIKKMYT